MANDVARTLASSQTWYSDSNHSWDGPRDWRNDGGIYGYRELTANAEITAGLHDGVNNSDR